MSTDNLALWHAVEKTDPDHTKPITGKAYKGNSPKPHYLVHKATETFGPCGIGWGFEIVDEKLLDGALLAPGFNERIHMARIKVWYKWNGERGEVEHVGQTVFCGRRKDGSPFTDEDAPKKSVTDALVKALSMIGFAGDIFMGRYDDSKYVAELRQEAAEEQRAARQQARPELATTADLNRPQSQLPPDLEPAGVDQAEFRKWVREVEACATVNDLAAIQRTHEFKAFKDHCSPVQLDALKTVFASHPARKQQAAA